MMKNLPFALAALCLLAMPLASSAQSSSNQPMTRAEVRQQLVDLEQAGYRPGTDKVTYPTQIQAAEQRVAEQQDAAAANATSYGPAMNGSSEQGMQPAQ
jgi:hypothetical protein